MKKRTILSLLLAVFLTAALGGSAFGADAFPEKNLKIM